MVEESLYYLGDGIEIPVQEAYKELLKRLESNNLEKCLTQLNIVFGAFEKSIPSERILDWAVDLIKGYRNVGKICRKILERYGSKIEEEVMSNYGSLMSDFRGENFINKLTNALGYLEDIRDVLISYNIADKAELKDRLEKLDELEELEDKLDNLRGKF